MPQPLLPLFPLGLVLFPRTPLPLHIFEDRYKEMMRDVLEAQAEFGVVLAGEKGIVNMGCTAVIDKVLKRYPDGRMDVLAVGRRRFEILELDDEKAYLRGQVEFFDDDDFAPLPPDTHRLALERYNELIQLEKAQEPAAPPELSDPQLSFQLAQAVPDVDFRQVLLSTRSESERMKRLTEFLPGYTSKQRQTQQMRALAPRNGHGKWPPSI
jgi:Lon protease-like protein